jgi:protein TonB
MAYLDQPAMSPRKVTAIVLVAILHIFVGYALISGLAYEAVKKVASDLKTFDVQDEPPPPPDEPPPPPETPKDIPPPPIVAPPPVVQTQTLAPTIVTVPSAPPVVLTPTAPPAPPAPPAPKISQAAGVKGNPSSWVTSDDYPPSAQREGVQGVSALTFEVNALGRIENCRVTSSSGSSVLDDTACKLVTRRGRYTPAKDDNGSPIAGGTKTLRFTWRLPAD